jgi:hypothetical protein
MVRPSGFGDILTQRFYYSTSIRSKDPKTEKRFNEWLAGLIDGPEGALTIAKNSNSSGLEITMDLRDEHCLYLVKQKFGGWLRNKT